ncbi:hypothetical protein [Nostoc sp. KVJ20]|uniref:hypothetical protein n=1 Tax=Nostoc sp. KVJ20 TaxID=457944 RepID=UPI00159F0593|nr:hypothetical protein [Nostoc sp. KVJ20]
MIKYGIGIILSDGLTCIKTTKIVDDNHPLALIAIIPEMQIQGSTFIEQNKGVSRQNSAMFSV